MQEMQKMIKEVESIGHMIRGSRQNVVKSKDGWTKNKMKLRKYTNVKGMHKKIKALTRMERCTSNGCTENKDGNITVEKMAIIRR